MLKELMKWHASLLKWLDNRQNNPNAIVARMLSDPNEKQRQADRRRRKSQFEQQVRQGTIWPISKTPKRNAFMTCPLQSNVSSKSMTQGKCRSATTMYEYENRNSELRQFMQHEPATEHLIGQGKPRRGTNTKTNRQYENRRPCNMRLHRLLTTVRLHCKLSLALLLQSIDVILYAQ